MVFWISSIIKAVESYICWKKEFPSFRLKRSQFTLCIQNMAVVLETTSQPYQKTKVTLMGEKQGFIGSTLPSYFQEICLLLSALRLIFSSSNSSSINQVESFYILYWCEQSTHGKTVVWWNAVNIATHKYHKQINEQNCFQSKNLRPQNKMNALESS